MAAINRRAADQIRGVPVPCNFCQAKIMWLRTDTGKLMPVDAHPDPDRGNVRRDGGHATVLDNAAAAAQRAAGVRLRVHHAATCPYADRWRRKTRHEKAAAGAPATEPTETGLW